jgi:hypothetical protein
VHIGETFVKAQTEAKETYCRGKRDLLQRQKRLAIEAKETYYRGKRDLL